MDERIVDNTTLRARRPHGWANPWPLPDGEPEPLPEVLERPIQNRRNGLPVPQPYNWRVEDQRREAEVEAQLAAIRAEARRRNG